MNEVWRRTPRGMRLTDEGKAFKNRCTNTVRELVLHSRNMRPLPPQPGWRLMVVFWLPRLETVQWLDTGKGERFTERDIDNLWKLTLDGIFQALGENDSQVIGLTTDKKFGHGEGRLDFMLKEEAVAGEEPNATELSEEINSRAGALRTSPMDPPAFLYHYQAHVPQSGEYRYTHFDAWRLSIMNVVLERFEELQGRLTCPARSGRLDACFGCTDFMVVYCLMNNPVALNIAKERTGLFDLCQQRVGSHMSLVDRPQGGERMEAQTTPKTPDAHFLEILGLLGQVEQNPRLLSPAMTAIFTMLSSKLVKADGNAQAQEACIKLAVVMMGLIEAGAGKPLPRSVIYYRDVTDKNMPEEVSSRIVKAGGAYKLCVSLYGDYRKLFIEWNKGQPPDSTQTTAQAQQPEPAQQDQAQPPTPPSTPEPQTQADPAAAAETATPEEKPAPERRTRRTRKELDAAAGPPVTEDASVEVQPSGDVPQTHEIPPDETPAEAPPAEVKTEEQPAKQLDEEVIPGLDPVFKAYLDKKFAEQQAHTDAQLKRLEAIAPAFNGLRDWLVKKAQG